MITYAPFFQTLKEKNISSYRLINYYNVSRGMRDRIRHNRPITTTTIETLCKILDCPVENMLQYYPDKNTTEDSTKR